MSAAAPVGTCLGQGLGSPVPVPYSASLDTALFPAASGECRPGAAAAGPGIAVREAIAETEPYSPDSADDSVESMEAPTSGSTNHSCMHAGLGAYYLLHLVGY